MFQKGNVNGSKQIAAAEGNNKPSGYVLLRYHFQDFYVSQLLFRNILFCASPVMPDIFVLHDIFMLQEHT